MSAPLKITQNNLNKAAIYLNNLKTRLHLNIIKGYRAKYVEGLKLLFYTC